jgi:hypothetical protein
MRRSVVLFVFNEHWNTEMPEGTRDLEVSIESEHWVGRSARGV